MSCQKKKKFHVSKWFEEVILWQRLNEMVQFSCSGMSDSLQPHEPQHTRPPCLSPTPGIHPNPCPLSQLCLPTISSSVVPFSSCPQSFPASGSFHFFFYIIYLFIYRVFSNESVLCIRWPKYRSFSCNISPINEHSGPISLQSRGLSRVSSNTTVQKHQFFDAQFSL